MLARGQRRSLSLKACVDRLLEQYEPLQHYFRLVTAEDPTHSTDRIVTTLNNPFMKAYLEFLSFQLERLNGFNRLFQGDYPLLHCLRAEIRGLLQAIAGDFLEPQYVRETAVEELDLGQGNRVPLEEVYIGMAATETLAEIRKGAEQSEVNVFLESCLAFLLEAFKQIKTRFDLTSPVYELVEWTLPANALQRKPTNLSQVLARMPYMKEKVNHVQLDTEWRSHIFTKDLRPEMPWEEYWKKVRDEKVLGSSKYPNLLQLVEVVASLPASNAAVERLFSQLKLIKREQRTALKPQSLVALMQTKMTLANKKETAASFEVSRELLKLAEQAKANATDEESRELKRSFCAKLAKDLNKL